MEVILRHRLLPFTVYIINNSTEKINVLSSINTVFLCTLTITHILEGVGGVV